MNGGAFFESIPNLPHGLNGIIVGYNVQVGKNVTIYQRVTIAEGSQDNPTVVGNNVVIGAGATILSGVRVGDNCKIGAGAVVTKNVPEGSTVVGIPAKVVH